MHPTEPKLVSAYGDREGDGMVQMSFVLPLPPSAKAREAAKAPITIATAKVDSRAR